MSGLAKALSLISGEKSKQKFDIEKAVQSQ